VSDSADVAQHRQVERLVGHDWPAPRRIQDWIAALFLALAPARPR
jgi:hypothetical protein